jgi:sigma-E factor negative regulatory protein RseC
MAEKMGIVIECLPGGWARVRADTRGVCSGCHESGGGCRTCLTSTTMESRAANPVGARAGDMVKISLRSANLFKGAAVLYLAPAVALLLGGLAGAWAAPYLGWSEVAGAIPGSGLSLGMAVVLIINFDRSRWARSHLTPVITGVLDRDDQAAPQTTAHGSCRG